MNGPETRPTSEDGFIRLPGLYRRWELERLIEPGTDVHIEEAGFAEDGTPLFTVYMRGRAEDGES